jgi:uncharacterized protein (DUF849 family)
MRDVTPPGTLITVAPTGAETAVADAPALPVTLDALVSTAKACQAEGAGVIHVHVRDDEGLPTLDVERLTATVAALREQTDLVVQLSTGGAVSDSEDARLAVLAAQPDGASLTCGTVNFGDDVFLNRWPFVERLYLEMQQRGIVPEFECFEIGHLATVRRLLDRHGPPAGGHVHVDLVCGVPGAMPGDAATVASAVAALAAAGGRDVLRDGRRAVDAAGAAGGARPRRAPAGRHGGHAQLRRRGAGARQCAAGGQGCRSRAARPAPTSRPGRRTPAARHRGLGRGTVPVADTHGGKRRLDRVLSADYLSELTTSPLPDVRALRDEAEQEEVDLSYLRRLLQGRIDILRAELARRESGGEGGSLLAELPRILGEGQRSAPRGMGRNSAVEPSRAGESRRYVESLVSDADLSDVTSRSDDELRGALETLTAAEHDVSAQRKQVHGVLDACSAEITRRYRDGEADVGDLLASAPQPPAGS